MNKALKYVLSTVAGICAVAIAVAAYLAATFNPNDYKPQIVQLVKDKFERRLKMDGDIKLTFYPALGADLGGLKLSEHGGEKEFAAIEAARVSLQLMPLLAHELVVDRIEVRGLHANLVKRKNGNTNVDDLAAGEAGKSKSGGEERSTQKPVQFNIDHLLIENASLDYADEGSGAKYTLSKVTLKTGRIAAATPTDIELAFSLGASQPKVDIEVRLKGSVEGDAKAIKSDRLALDFDAKQGERTIKAKLTSPLAIDLAAQTVELNKLVVNAMLTDPKSAPQQLMIDITGKAGLTHFSPPSFTFDVNVDKLDLDRYTAAKKPEGQTSVAGKAPAGEAEQALDFSALKTLQAGGSVKIGSLKAANLHAQNVRLDVKAGGGRLDVSPITAELYQGTINGSMSLVAAATAQIALKQNLTGISIGPLLKDAVGKDMLEGRGNVTIDAAGQGATVAAIKKALNGSAALNLADGALKGINIGETIRNAKARLGSLKGETTQVANGADKTDFTELKASFAIKNGIAHNSDLSLKSPLLRLSGEGDIDIGRDSMDYLAKATLVATAAGQGGKETAELKGFTVPVRISGPYTALSYKLDFNAMVGGAAQQKLDLEKEKLKSKAQDTVKDKLKGLFGR